MRGPHDQYLSAGMDFLHFFDCCVIIVKESIQFNLEFKEPFYNSKISGG